MIALFFQKYWSVVGNDVCRVILNILNRGSMPRKLNYTVILLISKVKKPKSMKDLRPFSLCNMTYKLISKVMANHLKSIIPRIIDD